MKISENWLREWVNPAISTAQLVEQLTMLGLEVDDVLPAAGAFNNVVVAEIIVIDKHPDADKLNVCQVNIGAAENLQIVCGAPNARVGLITPLAMIGAVLPGDFTIKKSKLRGIESHGMLCSDVELGLSDDSAGLKELPADAPLGQSIREYLHLNDNIIDIDLTPNRADCFCIKGIAIDIACLNDEDLTLPNINDIKATHDEQITVNLLAEKQCPRYLCRVINNIDNSKSTPIWMQERLRRGGIRSIHPVVDVTNYVMLELGQPMHGFDKSAIDGAINIKMASSGETITLLDGKEIKLNDTFLMIADEQRYLAIAGVMGGLNSGVTATTQDIVLESAFFDPATIMGKSRDLGIHTESALRFERGVDAYVQQQAMQRATDLIIDICGGEVGHITTAVNEDNLPIAKPITLSKDKLTRVLGFEVANSQVTSILTGLNMQVKHNDDEWQVTAPTSRFDIIIAEDLIEEVVRIIGYDKMPAQNLFGESIIMPLPEAMVNANYIKLQLNTLGYQEVINYSFVSAQQLSTYSKLENSIALKNPLTEEFAIMRTTLLPGIMETVKYNLRRQHDSIKMFETGHVFWQHENIVEKQKIIAICTGKRCLEHWGLSQDNVDFYDLKGDLEILLDNTKNKYYFTQSQHEFLHPGRQANVVLNEVTIGWIGQVHPEICRRIGIKKDVYTFELTQDYIQVTQLPQLSDISKYPSVRRDIAMVIDSHVCYQQIKEIITKELAGFLVEIIVFDKYQGENIGKNKCSLAVGLVLQQNNSTFADKEVDKLIAKVLNSIQSNLGVEIRGL
ncbi:MAG: phenylalanine--tRNA ligase subunit beta [Proteobacteria bacterium]|nr:phenylalanine--tRNA ligase subunit beta [Pseudomonadota bacterium]